MTVVVVKWNRSIRNPSLETRDISAGRQA